MTVIMQSSSAAVATTLAALHSQAISFESAAALVIGQNIGTSRLATAAVGETALFGAVERLAAELRRVIAVDRTLFARDSLQQLQQTAETMAAFRRTHRDGILRLTAKGEIDPVTADARLDTMRWLDRLMYHLWRAINHLGVASADGQGWEKAGNKSTASDGESRRARGDS
jgi:hypothetical protein